MNLNSQKLIKSLSKGDLKQFLSTPFPACHKLTSSDEKELTAIKLSEMIKVQFPYLNTF